MSAGVGAASDTGRVRSHNEDAYLVQAPVYVVADGMGGHAAGEVASRLALDSLAGAGLSAEDGQKAVRRALGEANRAVFEEASGPSRGMGTTCVLLLLGDGVAHLGHVGDSRAYQLRDGSLTRLTRDHTVVEDMVEQGVMTEEQAQTDAGRSFLTRALGSGATVEVDVTTVEALPADRFLLCSDGLTAMLRDAEIREVLLAEPDPQAVADRLVAAANAAGGEDNVTALVVDPLPAGAVVPDAGRRPLLALAQAAIVLIALTAGLAAMLLFSGILAVPGATPSLEPTPSLVPTPSPAATPASPTASPAPPSPSAGAPDVSGAPPSAPPAT